MTCLCMSILDFATAQSIERSVISSSGGGMGNPNLSFDFTVGEALNTTMEAGSFILTQGFHQTEILEVNHIKEGSFPEVNFKIYPVPAEDKITLELSSSHPAAVSLSITAIDGRTLFQQENVTIYPSYKQSFLLHAFASGAYFLNIHDQSGTLVKSLRFLKK